LILVYCPIFYISHEYRRALKAARMEGTLGRYERLPDFRWCASKTATAQEASRVCTVAARARQELDVLELQRAHEPHRTTRVYAAYSRRFHPAAIEVHQAARALVFAGASPPLSRQRALSAIIQPFEFGTNYAHL
jgi:hypothetical protein